MEKIWIEEPLFVTLSLEGPMDDIIKELQEIYTKFPNYKDFKVNIESCEEYFDIRLTGKRIETDKELERRIARQNRQKQYLTDRRKKKLEKELMEFQRLKSKFEKI